MTSGSSSSRIHDSLCILVSLLRDTSVVLLLLQLLFLLGTIFLSFCVLGLGLDEFLVGLVFGTLSLEQFLVGLAFGLDGLVVSLFSAGDFLDLLGQVLGLVLGFLVQCLVELVQKKKKDEKMLWVS